MVQEGVRPALLRVIESPGLPAVKLRRGRIHAAGVQPRCELGSSDPFAGQDDSERDRGDGARDVDGNKAPAAVDEPVHNPGSARCHLTGSGRRFSNTISGI